MLPPTVAIALIRKAMPSDPSITAREPTLDRLMLFGFLGMLAAILFYREQKHSRAAGLLFPICLACLAVYGFLQGAWPLGIMQCVWSGTTFYRWFKPRTQRTTTEATSARLFASREESRITRLFGRVDSEHQLWKERH
jgi:hypothetical protein